MAQPPVRHFVLLSPCVALRYLPSYLKQRPTGVSGRYFQSLKKQHRLGRPLSGTGREAWRASAFQDIARASYLLLGSPQGPEPVGPGVPVLSHSVLSFCLVSLSLALIWALMFLMTAYAIWGFWSNRSSNSEPPMEISSPASTHSAEAV